MTCKKGKIKVKIKKYDFYEGKEQTISKTITPKMFKEIKSWKKSHPEFSNSFSIKKVKC